MIMDSNVIQNSVYQQNLCHVWVSIKNKNLLNISCCKNFVKCLLNSDILQNKKCSMIKSFLINEISFLLSKITEETEIFNFLNEFSNISFSVSILFQNFFFHNKIICFIFKLNL